MNKITCTLVALLASTALFAQTREEKWNVYNLQTSETTVIDIADVITSKAIVGQDDRIDITGQATDFEKAAVVLEMTNGRGNFLCSGSMIGKNMVLTAAHCLTYNGKPFSNVQVVATGITINNSLPDSNHSSEDFKDLVKDYLLSHRNQRNFHSNMSDWHSVPSNQLQAKQNKTSPNFSNKKSFPLATATKLWIPEEWDDRKPLQIVEPFDYGIIMLDKNLGEKTGWLNVATKSAKELKGKNIILLGRGGDKPRRTLWRAEGIVGIVDNLYLYHNADMVGGNSGGPVMLEEDPYTIVALNNFGHVYPNDQAPEGAFPNGSLLITEKIINATEYNRN